MNNTYGIDHFIWCFHASKNFQNFWKNMREFSECIKG